MYFFNSTKITQKNEFLSYSIKLLESWDKFQSSYDINKYAGSIVGLILEEIIMSDRHMSGGKL